MVSRREIVKSSADAVGRKEVAPTAEALNPAVAAHTGRERFQSSALPLTHLVQRCLCHVLPLPEDAQPKNLPCATASYVQGREKG